MDWPIRRQVLAGSVTVVALFLGIGVFGLYGRIAGAIVSPGQVDLETHSQIVQHPDGGVVAAIGVRDGDRVRAGDVLLSLDGGQLRSDLAIIVSQLVELRTRAARLTAEQRGADTLAFPTDLVQAAATDAGVAAVIDGQRAVFEAGRRTFDETVDSTREQQRQIRNEAEGQTAQAAALGEQADLVRSQYETAEGLLQKGLADGSRVSELKRTMVALLGQQAQTRAGVAANRAEIARLDTEIGRLAAARQEKAVTDLRDAEVKIAELSEQKLALERKIARLDLRAPRDGIVQSLQIHTIGAVIRPADPVLSVVPQDKLFTIIARIDTHKVDSVFVGQDTALRFSSFDARTTPEIRARITRVAADIVTDSRTGAQFYTAEATPDPGEIEKLAGKDLLPGMPVEVYIQTGERSPLSYFLKPFLDFVGQAFRE